MANDKKNLTPVGIRFLMCYLVQTSSIRSLAHDEHIRAAVAGMSQRAVLAIFLAMFMVLPFVLTSLRVV